MRRSARFLAVGAVLTLGVTLLLLTTFASAASKDAQHVRWDIISLVPGNPPTINPGGHASATAPNGGDTITLTGSGTFVAPASGGGSSAATGGGTWTTSTDGSGTYTVTGLVSWVNAGPQAPTTPPFIDNIDHGTRVNGTAVLTITFSDGNEGVLTIGCHGPGAPPGIFEGIAVTKGYTTYYNVPAPVPGVDAGRTNFHVR